MSKQSQPAIQLLNVSKRFAFTPETPQSVLETIIAVFSRRRRESHDLWAVHEVSLEVAPGECVGIIGRNGSGKSTLLKLIARIIQPTTGKIMVLGRVSALLELGAGFHPDLTGRENIFLNASLLGLTAEETDALYDDIVEFSELGQFIDMPVKHYSSGMYMRLGFSVAIHVRPDILIVDEILAVGDETFQAKCMDRILDMKRNGTTILFISHKLDSISSLCNRVIWLDQGKVRLAGPADSVLAQYRAHLFQQVGNQLAVENHLGGFRRWGTRQIEITAVSLRNQAGEETTIFNSGEPLYIEIAYLAHEPVDEPEFGLAFHSQDGVHIAGPNTRLGGLSLGVITGTGRIRYAIGSLPFMPGRYRLTAAIHDSKDPIAYDFHQEAYSFRVVEGNTPVAEGLIALEATWERDAGDVQVEPRPQFTDPTMVPV